MKKQQKKISFQSVAFGCTVLSAVLIGAWFLFPLEEIITKQFVVRKSAVSGIEPVRSTETVRADLKTGETPERIRSADPGYLADHSAFHQGKSEVIPLVADNAADLPAAKEDEQSSKEQILSSNPKQQTGRLQTFPEENEQTTGGQEGFRLNQAVADHLNSLITKLSAKPPTVLRETDDLYTVLANTAHLFRVLGKEEIQFIQNFLKQEQGRLEDVAAELHAAVINNEHAAAGTQIRIPLETAYEYAGFFLHTMGGRSYLFRRTAKTRLLISYYAILIIDETNRRELNAYGIDVGETLPLLIQEMEGTTQLAGKDRYLEQLYRLQEKYRTGP